MLAKKFLFSYLPLLPSFSKFVNGSQLKYIHSSFLIDLLYFILVFIYVLFVV